MTNYQDHIKEQEERVDQDERDAHENWLLDQERKAENITFEQARDRFIECYENVLI